MLCPRDRLMEAVEALRAHGNTATVHDVDYVFDDADALNARLAAALATAAKPARP